MLTYRAYCGRVRSAPDGAQLNALLAFTPTGEIQADGKTSVVGGEFCPFVAAGPDSFNHPAQVPTVTALCMVSTPPKVLDGAGTVPGWTMRL